MTSLVHHQGTANPFRVWGGLTRTFFEKSCVKLIKCRQRDDVSERTTGEAAERQEAIDDVTQEVEVPEQVGAFCTSIGENCSALNVRRAQFGIADIANVHQEVEGVPQSSGCRLEVSCVSHLFSTCFTVFEICVFLKVFWKLDIQFSSRTQNLIKDPVSSLEPW